MLSFSWAFPWERISACNLKRGYRHIQLFQFHTHLLRVIYLALASPRLAQPQPQPPLQSGNVLGPFVGLILGHMTHHSAIPYKWRPNKYYRLVISLTRPHCSSFSPSPLLIIYDHWKTKATQPHVHVASPRQGLKGYVHPPTTQLTLNPNPI